ncbi:unnamed protein product [Cylicostephanus goldi]|uniref:Uncharacterized protein n=1 Tax=Cylicostephanus goldi TaxID=71465 RepID=A0A3P6RSA0_CYLGO|nr:unnamed protein product [Cylicostephanus goldi]
MDQTLLVDYVGEIGHAFSTNHVPIRFNAGSYHGLIRADVNRNPDINVHKYQLSLDYDELKTKKPPL